MKVNNYENRKTTILSLSWRDITSPNAGGAEVHTHEMLRRADKTKYEIYHFSTKQEGQPAKEMIDGVHYIRHGNAITVILAARRYYRKHCNEIDFVIDQCNTHRFFTPLWVEKKKRIFYIHQLTKEIWDYSARFPLSKIGKATEELMLKLNRNDPVITVSESTKQELIERGYQPEKIRIIHNGVSFQPWTQDKWCVKEPNPTFIYAGRYSPYKGIDVAIEAFGRVKEHYPNAKLWIIGKRNEEYIEKHLRPICDRYQLEWEDDGDIISWGYVSEERKLELLSKAWVLLFPSIREGWGIPITEAGCVGTPCIAFDSPGIREAVDYGRAGYLCMENTTDGLFAQMLLAISDEMLYSSKRKAAYAFSSQFTWDKAGAEFERLIEELRNGKL